MADIQMDKFWQDRGLLPADVPEQEPEPVAHVDQALRLEALRAAVEFCQDDPSADAANVVAAAHLFLGFLTGTPNER